MTNSKSRPQYKTAEQRLNFPIVRCNRQERFKLAFYCLSSDVHGEEVHWAGKSHICPAPDSPCTRCSSGQEPRWVGYLAATNHDRTKLFIVEVTPGVMAVIDAYFKRWGSLRGSYITLTRPSGKDQGRISIEILRNDVAVSPQDLPPAFDLERTLKKIYGISEDQQSQELLPTAVNNLEDPPVAVPTMPSACERESVPPPSGEHESRISHLANGFKISEPF